MEAQIGRETTPKEYISRLTEVFTEVRRVLCPAGTLWLNISDTYAGKGNQGDFIDPKMCIRDRNYSEEENPLTLKSDFILSMCCLLYTSGTRFLWKPCRSNPMWSICWMCCSPRIWRNGQSLSLTMERK